MISRIRHLVVKELLAALRDPRARIILVFPPIMQILIFAFAITQEVNHTSIAIVNRDSGLEGASLIKSFGHEPVFRKILFMRTNEEVNEALDRRQILGALIIPSDFSKRLISGSRSAEVQILLDGRRTNAAGVLGGYMNRIILQYGQQTAIRSSGSSDSYGFAKTGLAGGINVITRHWFNPNLIPRNSFLPGLVCLLTTVVGVLVSGLSIARERETGTFDQLLVSPLSPLEILIGKASAAVFLAACSAVMVSLIVIYGFGLELQGPFFLLVGVIIVYLISIVGIGLFVSSLSTTQQQAILGCFLILPPSIMLSGFATPVENMPFWLEKITIANPVRWFLVIMKGLFLKGISLPAILNNMIPLLIIAVVTMTASVFMFKKRME